MKIEKLKEIYLNYSDNCINLYYLRNKMYFFDSNKCLFIDYLRKKFYFFDFNDYDVDDSLFYRFKKNKIDDFCKNKIIENSRFILKQKLENKLQIKETKEKRIKI